MAEYQKRYNRRANTNTNKSFRNETIESSNYVLNTDIWYQSHLIPKSGNNLTTVMALGNNQEYNGIIRKYEYLQMPLVNGSFNTFYNTNFKLCIPEMLTQTRDYAIKLYTIDNVLVKNVSYDIDYNAGTITLNATKQIINAIFPTNIIKVSFWKYIGGTLEDIFDTLDRCLKKDGDAITGSIELEGDNAAFVVQGSVLFTPNSETVFYSDVDYNYNSLVNVYSLLFKAESGIKLYNAGSGENIGLGYDVGFGSLDTICIGNLSSRTITTNIGTVSIGAGIKSFNNNATTLIGYYAGNSLTSILDGDIIFGHKNIGDNQYYDLIKANTFSRHFSPATNGNVNLGLSNYKWNNVNANNINASTITSNANDNVVTLNGDFTVSGNFIVSGSQIIVDAETVEIADNIIVLNKNLTTAPPSDLLSGFEINRGISNSYYFYFRESDDSFVIGESGNLQCVATRETTPNNNGVSYWLNSDYKFKTNSNFTYDGTKLTVPYLNLSSVTPNSFLTLDNSGNVIGNNNISYTNNTLTVGDIIISSGVNTRIPYFNLSNKLTSISTFTFNGSLLSIPSLQISNGIATSVIYFDSLSNVASDSTFTYDGTSVVVPNIKISSGADTRVPFYNSTKQLTSEIGFSYASNILTVPDLIISSMSTNKIPFCDANKKLITSSLFYYDATLGEFNVPFIKMSGFTENSILYFDTFGHVSFNSTITYDGTNFVAPNITISDGIDTCIPYYNSSKKLITSSNLKFTNNERLDINSLNISNSFIYSVPYIDSFRNVSFDVGFKYVTGNLYTYGLNIADMAISCVLYTDIYKNVKSSTNLTFDGTTLTAKQINNTNFINAELILNSSTETPVAGYSGMRINRGGANSDYLIEYDETSQDLKIGMDGSLQSAATRENSPNANSIAFWNNSSKRFDTSAQLTYSSSTLNVGSTSALTVSSTTASTNSSTGCARFSGGIGVSGAIHTADSINVTSTTKASRPVPVMTTTQKNAISTPSEGMQVFDSTVKLPSFHNGTSWLNVMSGMTSGTFTPTFLFATAPTYTSQIGNYSLFGTLCFAQVKISWTGSGSTSNYVAISGFPFTLPITANITIGYFGGITTSTALMCYISGNNTEIRFRRIVSGGTPSNVLMSDIAASGEINVSFICSLV